MNSEVIRKSIREMVHSRKSLMVSSGLVGPVDTAPPSYRWNQRLSFGHGGQARLFFQKGWSFDEPGFVWTDGPSASLTLGIENPNADLCLQLRCRAFLPEGKNTQLLKVRINGAIALVWSVGGGEACFEGRIFRHLLSELCTLSVAFEVERPISPMELGMGGDERKLGIAIYELALVITT
ncbi:MAG: hypothetical protein SFV32_07745 [Opitutaceae bacterium]|nr:hypothetical protein [Opitutaceae bacterium]